MFLKIIIATLILSVAIEFYLRHSLLKGRTKWFRVAYYILTALCILPYATLLLISQYVELSGEFFTSLRAILLILFLVNTFWKIPLAIALPFGTKWPQTAATILSTLATVLILYGTLWERYQIRTTEHTLYYENLPEGADGLRIVQIGDIHIGNRHSRYEMLTKMQQRVMDLKGDLVVDCGDMVDIKHTELDSTAMAILSRITAPLGVYTVTGNHDRGDYITDTIALPREVHRAELLCKQHQMGWHNISDSTATLLVGGDTLHLTAINYPASLIKGEHGKGQGEDYTPLFDHLPKDAFNIVVAHTPAMWEDILAATQAELTLSGHVHAMQLRLPIGPRGWSPASFVYKYWSGLYQKGNNHLIVTDGIGGGVPFRIGAKPQIVVITLKKK